MIGCLNVLSRLNNPGIRIIPPILNLSRSQNFDPVGLLTLNLSTVASRTSQKGGKFGTGQQHPLHHYDYSTETSPMLVNFEQVDGHRVAKPGGRHFGHCLDGVAVIPPSPLKNNV